MKAVLCGTAAADGVASAVILKSSNSRVVSQHLMSFLDVALCKLLHYESPAMAAF
jgi:hypothetical protein